MVFCPQERNVPWPFIAPAAGRELNLGSRRPPDRILLTCSSTLKSDVPRSIAAALSATPEEWWIRARNAIGLQSATQLLTFSMQRTLRKRKKGRKGGKNEEEDCIHL